MKTITPFPKTAISMIQSAKSSRHSGAAVAVVLLLAIVAGTATARAGTVYQVSTFAGVMPGSADGPAGLARFSAPTGIAVDATGTIYVADTGNNTIRRISSSGTVSTLFGTPRKTGTSVMAPGALTLDAEGNFYIGQWPGICKLSPTGDVLLQIPAGGGFVPGIAVANDGTIYYVNVFSNRIDEISPEGAGSIFAGSPDGTAGSADGAGTAAQFRTPWGLAIDREGTVYVTDGGNYTIRKISPSGDVTTLAGAVGNYEPADGTGSAAHFAFPQAVTVDADGNLYVGDGGGTTVRKVTPEGTVTTLAGVAEELGSIDGTGSAARFDGVLGIAVTGDGTILVTDNSTIRRVATDGTVTTLAGQAVDGSTDGSLDTARFGQPSGVTVAANGDIYVTQVGSPVRKISNAGNVSTLAISDVIVGTSGQPTKVAIAADGTIYAANNYDHTISMRSPSGGPTLLAGTAGVSGSDDGVGAAASFVGPYGVALDADGDLIVADALRIRKVAPDGTVTTLAGGSSTFGGVALDGQGTDATFYGAFDVAIDPDGNIWVADSAYGASAVRKVTPGGLVSTLAGGLNYSGYAADGTGTAAQFSGIQGIAVAPGGDLYVVESADSTVRQVTTAGVVTTIAGRHRTYGAVDGQGDQALFNRPQGVGVDSSGSIFVADQSNHAIRVITVGTAPTFDTQPQSATLNAGGSTTLTTHADVSDTSYQWEDNGVSILAANGPSLTLSDVQPADAGVYAAVAANGLIETKSDAAIVGVLTTEPVIGAGTVVGTNILHPNGNHFDQVLVTGAAETIATQGGRITRTSFIDLDDNIVQVEFAGAGSLSLVLAASSGPSLPVSYSQDLDYMKGQAGIVIVGADETTNVSVFTVGRATAFDPTGHYDITKAISDTNDPATNGSLLFVGKAPSPYAGIAKIAFIAIASTDGKFGGLRAANARFQGWGGLTGVYAPGVEFEGPVYLGDITAYDDATPVIITGAVSDARVTGGNLFQDNTRAVQVSGLTQLKFTAGSDSAGVIHPAQANQAVLEQDGVDVTAQIVAGP